jgi:hypothetical protein
LKHRSEPPLVPLDYGNPYCEDCGDTLAPGMLVAWWKVIRQGEVYKTVVCAACHRGRVKAGR